MILLFQRLVGTLAAAFVQKVNHETQIDMLVKFLETYNNFAAYFEFFICLLSDICLQIFEKSADSVVLKALKYTISQFIWIEVTF